ncbi:type I restriction system endonuclease [Mycoplasmopsis citelli]|uniref:Type I restriction enzyme endonuclease subunit n=1 Tax=Mycoplasmopsis citelli TaxID=171281 RepID=A0A449B0R2_9BACT|nr:type I restriction endonuclease subunit R [Mycoplasmopsis citelli]VEU74208.1 type I restriction system endonuclease [Mycoplasmopsis citelli]
MDMKQIGSYNDDNWVVVKDFKETQKQEKPYQSEEQLENDFIKRLENLGYEYRPDINNEDLLKANLREQIQKLNKFEFKDKEWKRFYKEVIINAPKDIYGAAEKLQKIKVFAVNLIDREEKVKNIKIIDDDISNNSLQVINQYNTNSEKKNRYDVTILVNGLPLVQIELKRRGVNIKDAFEQIERYHEQSYSSGDGLFEYLQLFVISNGTFTKYYSNTTRWLSIKDKKDSNLKAGEIKTSNSYEFTINWADQNNEPINDLEDFTTYFFRKRTILSILIKYCVLTEDKKLLVMRPYQITACEEIQKQTKVALNNPKLIGTVDAGGYIWHSTGSGKTLTSFKVSQLLVAEFPNVKKVVFVVDRKDLDFQTIREFENYQKGSVSGTSSTKNLDEKLNDFSPQTSKKIIVTTIQKLNLYIKNNKNKKWAKDNSQATVFIFDECHRSQFGETHKKIKEYFKDYIFFGFTGTPIFEANTDQGKAFRTTRGIFGEKLHAYTILNAIKDENVLKFKIEYNKTAIKVNKLFKVKEIDKNFEHPRRIESIVEYTLNRYDRITNRQQKEMQKSGFNSLFACDSTKLAGLYYQEFKKQIAQKNIDLKIATIFSKEPSHKSENILDYDLADGFKAERLSVNEQNVLQEAINDFNNTFKTNYELNAEGFDNYYKEVSKKVKNREIDILIVCSMFLTGFDAPTLNTLWLDKDLTYHNLVQALSRTNRIYSSLKPHGNIVTFRDLKEQTEKALKLFSDKNASEICLLRDFRTYYEGPYSNKGRSVLGYRKLVEKLKNSFPLEALEKQDLSEEEEQDFIRTYNDLERTEVIVKTFDEFGLPEYPAFNSTLRQDYKSHYLKIYDKHQDNVIAKLAERNLIDLEYEINLIQNSDYGLREIIKLIEEQFNQINQKQEIKESIKKILLSQYKWRDKISLLDEFIDWILKKLKEKNKKIPIDYNYEWRLFIEEKINQIIEEIIVRLPVKDTVETRIFFKRCFDKGEVKDYGKEFNDLVKGPIFGNKNQNRLKVSQELNKLINKFRGLY